MLVTLEIVGSGFGRTGTNSLKLALEQLGFAPCHHMFEVRDNPRQLPFWQRAAAGEKLDWNEVFAEYRACVDWPAAHFWREIHAAFPTAKVLHSHRDENDWFNSVHETIYPAMLEWETAEGTRRDRLVMANELIVNQAFDGRLSDKEHAISVYRAHEKDVRRTVPAEQLLVFDVRQGWAPLCEFLEVAAPDVPFPRTNSTAEFHQRPR
jgi:hypothetical protein